MTLYVIVFSSTRAYFLHEMLNNSGRLAVVRPLCDVLPCVDAEANTRASYNPEDSRPRFAARVLTAVRALTAALICHFSPSSRVASPQVFSHPSSTITLRSSAVHGSFTSLLPVEFC